MLSKCKINRCKVRFEEVQRSKNQRKSEGRSQNFKEILRNKFIECAENYIY
jgi:hypothetical protein